MDIIEGALKLSQVGSTALLLLALIGAYKGWWVPGWVYYESVKREASWQELYNREKMARDTDRSTSLINIAELAAEKTLELAQGKTRS